MESRVHLKFEELVKYLGGNVGSRCVIEGECVFNAGLVMIVGTKGRRDDGKLNVLSFVLQTSGLSKGPLQVSGVLQVSDEGEVTVISMTCSCKAGNSEKCKHTSATLWFLYRNDLDNLEELSSTDIKCLWTQKQKKDVSRNYSARKIKDFCHVSRRVEEKKVPEDFGDLCRRTLLAACPNSAFALHRAGRIQENQPASSADDIDMS